MATKVAYTYIMQQPEDENAAEGAFNGVNEIFSAVFGGPAYFATIEEAQKANDTVNFNPKLVKITYEEVTNG